MEAALSIYDHRDRRHPDGEGDNWGPDVAISDDESDDD
jgi:hypothetical protein